MIDQNLPNTARAAAEEAAMDVRPGDMVVKNGRSAYYALPVLFVIAGDGVEVRTATGFVAFYAFGTFKVQPRR